MQDQAEKLRQLVQQNKHLSGHMRKESVAARARVITVTSGKGGVGKTNITVNLAIAFAKLGKKVLIMDADLGTANVDVVLGCSASHNLLQVLEEGFDIEKAVAEGPYGIKFLSGGSGMYRLTELSDSQLQHMVNQVTLLDQWADIILIDTGAGLSRSVLNFVIAADDVVLVTTPEPTAITDAYAMMKTYIGYKGTAPLRLIVNRAFEQKEGDLVADKLTKAAFRFLGLSITSLGIVFEDRNLVNAVKKQQPLLISFPGTASARCIEYIAQRLLYGSSPPETQGFKGFVTKLFGFLKK